MPSQGGDTCQPRNLPKCTSARPQPKQRCKSGLSIFLLRDGVALVGEGVLRDFVAPTLQGKVPTAKSLCGGDSNTAGRHCSLAWNAPPRVST